MFRFFEKLKALDPALAKGFKKFVIDKNKMSKQFIPKHYLDNVVKKVGGEENLVFELYRKIGAGSYTPFVPIPTGSHIVVKINIQGFDVTIQLSKFDGIVRIGSLWIPQP